MPARTLHVILYQPPASICSPDKLYNTPLLIIDCYLEPLWWLQYVIATYLVQYVTALFTSEQKINLPCIGLKTCLNQVVCLSPQTSITRKNLSRNVFPFCHICHILGNCEKAPYAAAFRISVRPCLFDMWFTDFSRVIKFLSLIIAKCWRSKYTAKKKNCFSFLKIWAGTNT